MAPDSLRVRAAAAESMQQLQPVLFFADADSQEGAIHIHGNGIPAYSHGQANSVKITKITIFYIYNSFQLYKNS
jgi:hypothetical protein